VSRVVRRALLSVSNKEGLPEFARALRERGVTLLSTGGTARLLRHEGIETVDVAQVTGFPEIMDGRVKTLHPRIHGGLLGRRGIDDAVMSQHGIEPIDLLAVNLYPFAATIAKPGCTFDDAIENIDIGGPAMVRAAAKNHDHVTVIVDPLDYGAVLAELAQSGGGVGAETRRRLAAKAFAHTAQYDATVASYLDGQVRGAQTGFPEWLALNYRKRFDLRYGENPHQQAAFYSAPQPRSASVGAASQLQGKDLSYNNLADADCAFECVRQFDAPACTIVKHANPCGVAVARDLRSAYDLAYRTDPTSAFGGIIAFNRELDEATAHALLERQFVEVIVAPALTAGAREACARKENVRVLVTGEAKPVTTPDPELRSINGGLLAQTRDVANVTREGLQVVTRTVPTPAQLDDLLFAWRVCKFVKSNAIVFARDGATVGIGAGQMSRVVSTRIAGMKARDEGLDPVGSVMASDAFFPFRDGLDAAAEQGVKAVIQPGGSKRDAEVIAAADEHGIAMVMTGVRHFRH
jgi:phosphoribosylaminoimidazolecarboxamide formyltransferase/IMP cyclohydrolase